jgi:hypothetical protein
MSSEAKRDARDFPRYGTKGINPVPRGTGERCSKPPQGLLDAIIERMAEIAGMTEKSDPWRSPPSRWDRADADRVPVMDFRPAKKSSTSQGRLNVTMTNEVQALRVRVSRR